MDDNRRFEASQTTDGRYRLLIEAVTDYAIYMLDPEGLVTSWNPGAQRFKGYVESEILGCHFSRFYVEEDRASGLPGRALEIAKLEGRFESEGWRVRKDGTRFWAHVVIDPIRAPSGELVGFAKVTRDLTERREAQRKLEQAREALVHSQKMDAIGHLTGGIAHDFNNLLMAILSSLQLVQKRLPAEPRITPLLDNAVQAAKRGTSLTQRMLAFARRQALNPELVDVTTLVNGMIELLQRSLGPSIAIATNFDRGLDLIQVDTNQFEMALLNLAVNARDAMPNGGTMTISARQQGIPSGHSSNLSPGKYACLTVADTGEGMDEATLAKAAEPFFTTKGVGKGTGLGLSMVHGLAEQLGGRLILKSRRNEGTIAEIWLPTAEATIKPSRPEAAVPKVKIGKDPLVVLAVDDDPLVLMNTSAMLEDLGHEVLEATSGKQALDVLRQKQKAVDLVIADQAMPNMTGAELIKALRVDWPNLPIILATGYAELPPGAEADLKLAKPFGLEELAHALADVISQNGTASPREAGEDRMGI
jgi:PAS domain S-box-containing protein